MPQNAIQYSDRYYDDKFEYRHVILPKELASLVPINFLMTETEWRNLGVHQSPGWRQYSIFEPERHILLFKRPITKVE